MLRVNSPGGSYVASDAIWRETVRAREAGNTVVVSMGEVAASGGYFIAMAANAIVAQPGTITGSIGVLSGKPVLSEALLRAGITTDSVSEGAHADMFTASRPFSEEEWAKINSWLDRIYADFTGKVAPAAGWRSSGCTRSPGAGCGPARMLPASGWFDALGGLDDRTGLARRKAALPDTAPVRLYPRSHRWTGSGRPRPARSGPPPAASLFAETWGPVWRLAAQAGLPSYGPLLLPGRWVIQ